MIGLGALRTTPPGAERLGVELVERDDVFRRADVLSVHLRNTPEVRGLVGARELALMQPSAYVVNTARGALVDQDAMPGRGPARADTLAGAGPTSTSRSRCRPSAIRFGTSPTWSSRRTSAP